MLCTSCIWITICLSVALTDEKMKHSKNSEKQERKGLPKRDADVFVTFLRPDASSAVLNDKILVNLYRDLFYTEISTQRGFRIPSPGYVLQLSLAMKDCSEFISPVTHFQYLY